MQARETFDEVPELYDRARPDYPAALWDDLAAEVGLRPGSRVLEIGPGTGQATRALVARGYEVVALEPGTALAALLRRNVPAAEVIEARFEDWPAPREPFDAVVAATSWHWVPPNVAMARAAAALRPRGALAVVSTHQDRKSVV